MNILLELIIGLSLILLVGLLISSFWEDRKKKEVAAPKDIHPFIFRYRYLLVFGLLFILTFFLEDFTNFFARVFFALIMMAVISLLYPTKKTKGVRHE